MFVFQAFMMIVKSTEVDENEPEIRKPDKLIQYPFVFNIQLNLI